MSLVRTSGRRHLAIHRWQTGLAITGIALGVAVVVGVDIANDSVRRAFAASTELVTGRATHRVVGYDGIVDESLVAMLQTVRGIDAVAPIVQVPVRLAAEPDRALTLLGLDPFLDPPFRSHVSPVGGANVDLLALLTGRDTVVLPTGLAQRLDVGRGDSLPIVDGAGTRTLRVVGIVDTGKNATDELVIADIATAQEIAGLAGRVSHIDLLARDASEAQIRAALPVGVDLVSAGARSRAVIGMTRAFRLNLTALGLLAMLVGTFLIYSTMSFMVVRQRKTHGMLRAIGVTSGTLFRTTLLDALVIGIPGTLAGLALGALLGTGLVTLVIQTVDDLYFRVLAESGGIAPLPLVKGAGLGLLGTLVAAWAPAREAARTTPRSLLSRATMERRALQRLPLQLAGAGVCLLATIALLVFDDSLVGAFAGLFAFVGAAALVTPGATAAASNALAGFARRVGGVPGWLAVRGIAASLSRTGVAVAALAVAVAAVIGVGTMIGSFRASVSDWLVRTVSADIYVGEERGTGETLDDELVVAIERLEPVAATRVIRHARVPSGDLELRLWAVRFEADRDALELIDGNADSAWADWAAGNAVLVSEPLAMRRDLLPGNRLTLGTPGGPVVFDVAGIFRDYTSDQGVAVIALDAYRRYWPDRSLSGIGVFLDPDADAGAARDAIESVVGARGTVTPSSEIRQVSLDIFDRTFTVTEVLRLLAGIVAFLGVFSALNALELERTREIATLRALGFTPRDVGTVIVGQTAALGLAAGLIAVPIGLGLAWLLVDVINARAFGWSMAFELSVMSLLQGVALAVAAALLAGILPALRSMRAAPAAFLRDE